MVQAFGCEPHNIQAGIGPSIGPQSYQVGEEVVDVPLLHSLLKAVPPRAALISRAPGLSFSSCAVLISPRVSSVSGV
jgi:copper oxidase (laccase) domain-containing protein